MPTMCVPNLTSVYLQQVEYFHSKFHTVYSVMNGLQMKMQCTLFDVVEYLQAMHEPYSSMPTKLIDFYKYIDPLH